MPLHPLTLDHLLHSAGLRSTSTLLIPGQRKLLLLNQSLYHLQVALQTLHPFLFTMPFHPLDIHLLIFHLMAGYRMPKATMPAASDSPLLTSFRDLRPRLIFRNHRSPWIRTSGPKDLRFCLFPRHQNYSQDRSA